MSEAEPATRETPTAPAAPESGVPYRQYHWLVLIVSAVILLLAFVLEVRADGRVFVRGAPQVVLPETCASKIMFDAECAGCGLTRSFIHLAACRPRASWQVHRAGWLLALLVVGQIPYRLLRLRGWPRLKWANWVCGGAIAAVLLHWFLALMGI